MYVWSSLPALLRRAGLAVTDGNATTATHAKATQLRTPKSYTVEECARRADRFVGAGHGEDVTGLQRFGRRRRRHAVRAARDREDRGTCLRAEIELRQGPADGGRRDAECDRRDTAEA